MEITYIIGNGLDIQYGFPTRYKDFYEFQNPIYLTKKEEGYINHIYESLFEDEINGYENWSDFELSIGKLTKRNSEFMAEEVGREKFIMDFIDVIDDLRHYLRFVEEHSSFDNGKTIDFRGTLNNIQNTVPNQQQSLISKVFQERPREHDYVNVLTLNYTSVFDRLYDISEQSFPNNLRQNSYYFHMRKPIHVHGTLDISMVLGVNDVEQISDKFPDEQKEELIKSQILADYREGWDIRNSEIINRSNIIVLYGVSIGETDKYLWNVIAEHSITNNIPVIIYNYVKDFDAGIPQRVKRLYKNIEDRFINNCGIDLVKEKDLRNNIIPVVGKTIFDLIEGSDQ